MRRYAVMVLAMAMASASITCDADQLPVLYSGSGLDLGVWSSDAARPIAFLAESNGDSGGHGTIGRVHNHRR